MTSPDEPKRTRANFPWILGTLVAGCAILGYTVWSAQDSARGALWQSFGINVASAVLLLAVLGLIEPRLRRNFVEAATRRFETAAAEVEERFESRVDELEERVESARALFENYMATEDNTVAAAANRPDFYTIASALAAANKAHAIDAFRGVSVPASEGIPSVIVRFHYATPVLRKDGRNVLLVAPSILEGPRPNGRWGWGPMEYSWQPESQSEEFGAYLMKELQNAGLKDVDSKVHWSDTIDRLTDALALAFDSRRTDGKLTGHLIEKGPGDWAITSEGIEYVGRGTVASVTSFPPVVTASMRRRGEESHEPWMDLEQPNWADSSEWDYMVARARKILPGVNAGPIVTQPPYVASTTEPRRPGPPAGGFDFNGA